MKKGCLVVVILFVVVIGMMAAGTETSTTNAVDSLVQKQVSGVENEEEYITYEEYTKIENGMTYEEVVEIIGSEGEETASTSGEGITISMYAWYGNGMAGSNANVTFENGKVTGKAQFGLE